MGSTEPDRSLGSGITLPQWMKTKIGDRYDLDETFSPPSYDDSFFYIRYPKIEKPSRPIQNRNYSQTSELLEKSEKIIKQDFSQHTAQCRQFIPEAKMGPSGTSDYLAQATRSTKPVGIDDGFTGNTAACGKSVVQVAHQMIAGSMLTRGFSTTASEKVATGEGFNRSKRRGSKSLPSSPLSTPPHSPNSSPQTRRRIQNRYFTGAFALEKAHMHPSGGQESANKYPGSWILSGLLGQQRDHLSDSVESVTIPEEDHKKTENDRPQKEVAQKNTQAAEIRRNKSMTSIVSKLFSEGSKEEDRPVDVEVGVDVAAAAITVVESASPTPKKAFRAKPSELREMNFWSPTSM